jgi:hypothetical protein
LVAYLHRAFGESPEDEGALKAGDLLFFATLKFADTFVTLGSNELPIDSMQ